MAQAHMVKGEVTPAQPSKAAQNPVRRFGMPELDKHGNFLVERLKTRYPQLTDRNIFSWLRGSLESNEVQIICTAHAIGMAQITHEPLDTQPIVKEVFVFVRFDKMEKGED